jgi:F420-dependent oxidoreductase-like protein
MRVCLMIEGQEGVTWDEWLGLARAAEDAGLDGLFRSDHYSSIIRPLAGALDAWTTLAGLAAATARLRLGTLVSPGTFRHPSVLARMATTVDHISGGRVELGMGAGWYDRDHTENGFPFHDARTRYAIFAEQVEIVVRSWTDEGFDFTGEHYTLHDQTALPLPVQRPHPPLVLGGTAKPRSAALAARFATEYNTLNAPADELRARRRRLETACVDVGRDPGTLTYSLMTTCVVGRDRAEVDARLGRLGDLLGDRDRMGDWPRGTVDEVAHRLGELRSTGLSRVMLQQLDHTDLDAVAVLGELAAAVGS